MNILNKDLLISFFFRKGFNIFLVENKKSFNIKKIHFINYNLNNIFILNITFKSYLIDNFLKLLDLKKKNIIYILVRPQKVSNIVKLRYLFNSILFFKVKGKNVVMKIFFKKLLLKNFFFYFKILLKKIFFLIKNFNNLKFFIVKKNNV